MPAGAFSGEHFVKWLTKYSRRGLLGELFDKLRIQCRMQIPQTALAIWGSDFTMVVNPASCRMVSGFFSQRFSMFFVSSLSRCGLAPLLAKGTAFTAVWRIVFSKTLFLSSEMKLGIANLKSLQFCSENCVRRSKITKFSD